MPAGSRLGVLTGGGDAPGLNAVIRAVVKAASNCGIEGRGSQRNQAYGGECCHDQAQPVQHFIGDGDRFQLAISQILGKRITYQELTGKGMERPYQDVPF